jgi:hypothetical protein
MDCSRMILQAEHIIRGSMARGGCQAGGMFAWGGRSVREIDEWAAVQAMCTLLAAWVEIWVRACGCRVGSGYRGSCNGIDVRRSMRSESMRYQLDPAGAAGSMCRRCTRIEVGPR